MSMSPGNKGTGGRDAARRIERVVRTHGDALVARPRPSADKRTIGRADAVKMGVQRVAIAGVYPARGSPSTVSVRRWRSAGQSVARRRAGCRAELSSGRPVMKYLPVDGETNSTTSSSSREPPASCGTTTRSSDPRRDVVDVVERLAIRLIARQVRLQERKRPAEHLGASSTRNRVASRRCLRSTCHPAPDHLRRND